LHPVQKSCGRPWAGVEQSADSVSPVQQLEKSNDN